MVEDVEHQRAVAGAHFVDGEVMVGEVREFVVLDQIACNGFAVVWAKQLGRGVPELPRVVGGVFIKVVFELGVTLAEEGVKFGFVAHGVEVKGLAWVEDDSLLGEVAIVGVV